MTREELSEKLEEVGIRGEWIMPDKHGFCRVFEFKIGEQLIKIDWYCNYSTLMIGNVYFLFDSISTYSNYPHQGKWIDFSFRNEHPLHLKVDG